MRALRRVVEFAGGCGLDPEEVEAEGDGKAADEVREGEALAGSLGSLFG